MYTNVGLITLNQTILITTNIVHDYNVGDSSNIGTAAMKTTTGQRSLMVEGVRFYNKLPTILKTVGVEHFKRNPKQ